MSELVDSLREAVVTLDPQRRIVEWKGASPRLFGHSAEEASGRLIDELLRPRDANGNPTCLGPTEEQARVRIIKALPEMEMLVETKGGRDLWVGVTCVLERAGDGRLDRSVVVARDITRRKKIDLAKSEVISAVSHELRSPLTSVKGFTSTLLNKWDRFDEETKKHLLLTINTDADRVTRLIGELLDVSRLEAGRLGLRRQMVDVVALVGRVVERLEPRAESHALALEFAPDFPDVYADPDKIEQVVTNLTENAIKYSEEGKVVISGGVRNGEVEIAVSDEGEGIPEDHRATIFGKFTRRGAGGDNPTGTGLGLYISKGLVEAHGGHIWVEDAESGGARFVFTIPTSRPE